MPSYPDEGIVAYLSHPLGDNHLPDLAVKHGDNMASAQNWFCFLIAATPWAIECSWREYRSALSQSFYGGRTTIDQHRIMRMCHLLVMVGGKVAPHMSQLCSFARELPSIPVLDLNYLGVLPPWKEVDRVRKEIEVKTDALFD
jgi:hypothetical protein